MIPAASSSPPPASRLDAAVLDRLLTHTASPDECDQVARWCAAFPNAADVLATLRALHHDPLRGGDAADDEAVTDAVRAMVLQRVRETRDTHDLKELSVGGGIENASLGKGALHGNGLWGHRTPRATFSGKRVWAVTVLTAAGVLSAFGLTRWRTVANLNAGQEPVQHYQTAPGQRSVVRLADGSAMTLAPATSVTLTPTGAQIKGEAYFTIVQHSSRPFVVRTENATVHVLGTRFSVRQYPGEARSRVVVEDGRVSVGMHTGLSATALPAVLSARMIAQVSDSGVTVSSGIATRVYTGWTQGNLVFDQVTLHDVIAELARAYDADIRVTDPTLAKRLVLIDVSVAEDPLYKVLGSLCNVTRAHVTREGRTFVLSPGRSATLPHHDIQPRHISPQPESQYGK